MNKGFGDGLSRAVELALTPVVFGLVGFGLDSLLGTSPVLAVTLAALALVGMVVRYWYGYEHEMRQHEAAASWKRGAATPAADVDLWGDGTDGNAP